MIEVYFAADVPQTVKDQFNAIEGVNITYIDKHHLENYDLSKPEVLMGIVKPQDVARFTNLKYFQMEIAGANLYTGIDPKITLCNASGAYGVTIAEHMLACTLYSLRGFDGYAVNQKVRNWHNEGTVKTIDSITVLALGMGDIGNNYAKRMKALGAHVIGVRRSEKPMPDYYDEQYTFDHLKDVIARADVIAMSLPETPLTKHIMDKAMLEKVKQDAILINVGRGSAIDELALIDLVEKKRFLGVWLDVFEVEPLPKNSPLWTYDNVHVTPHIAGRFNAAITFDMAIKIMYDNLVRYVKGEPLENVIDRKLGY